MKRILTSPVTHFNVLLVGTLCFIGYMHNLYHHDIEEDVHRYARTFCENNPEKCQRFLEDDDY